MNQNENNNEKEPTKKSLAEQVIESGALTAIAATVVLPAAALLGSMLVSLITGAGKKNK